MEKWTLAWTKLTELTETSIKAITNNLPGVYRLSYKADDGNYYIFYVGQAEDLKKRLLEHLSPSENNVCIRNYLNKKTCRFRYAKVTNSNIRNAAERQMYKQYEPSCNEKEPDGSDDIKVNLT